MSVGRATAGVALLFHGGIRFQGGGDMGQHERNKTDANAPIETASLTTVLGAGSFRAPDISKTNTLHRIEQRNQFFARALAHETNLDPVFLPQIFAVVAQQIS